MFKRILFTAAVLAAFAGSVSATPRFTPGFVAEEIFSWQGVGSNPYWAAGIQAFDFDSSGTTLYVLIFNSSTYSLQVVRDPNGTNELLYDFESSVYGSFLKLDGANPQNVWFGESSTGVIRSVVSNGGEGQEPTPRGSLDYNFDMAVNSEGKVFVTANTTFVSQYPGSGEIWHWTGAAWQKIADMGGSSSPLCFDPSDNLYYGFAVYNSTAEDVVFFTDEKVQNVIGGQPILGPGAATTYASDMNTHYGLAYDAAHADIFSSSSLGTVTRITGGEEYGPFGCGDSPSVVGCYGGDAYLLCTDWSDYSSTIFRLQPHPEVPLAVMKDEGGDQNLYVYNAPAPGEWRYCDLYSCNPSTLARDFWMIPLGADAEAMVALQADGAGEKELAVLKNTGGDRNLYVYNAPAAGDRTYWDCAARNPSPLARDFWKVPSGDGILALGAADISTTPDGIDELLVLKDTSGDVNLYVYNAPYPGDWTYWDAAARNPSPLARDCWVVPSGDAAALAAADTTGDGVKDRLGVVREQGSYTLYLWNLPVPGDWTYWDAAARNPSPIARDFWKVPFGMVAQGITALDADGGGSPDELVVLKESSGDQNLYVYNTPAAGDWNYWDSAARNPSPLARDFWVIPSGNDAAAVAGLE